MSPRVWFITGASSGFGRAAAEHVLEQGDILVATLRKPEVLSDLAAKYAADKLLVLKLDVTKPQEIAEAFQKAVDVFGRVDVVFNNAGFVVYAEVEGSPEDGLRRLFDTDFWGAMNVSREAVRVFREVNKPAGGRLLVTSSMAGIAPFPIFGYYCASKRALEGATETLAEELDPDWNVKITLIEAGSYHTNVIDSSTAYPPHPAYKKPTLPSLAARAYFQPGTKLPNDTKKGVAKVYQLAGLDNPPRHLLLGKDAYEAARKQIAALTKDMEQYEEWSADLLREDD